jgi:multidrug efflux pump subunit AcrB
MNLAEFSIRKKVITLTLTVVLVGGGLIAYHNLGRLEDPEFTIKDALVITAYPGATAREVEQEVSDEIEKAAQQLGQLERVTSRSERGLSTVTVSIKDKYDKSSLPQVWDELRRKVNDARQNLPPGAAEPMVVDDYGDVYGVFFAITGEGYSYEEIRRYAEFLQRELLLVQDVKRITLYGVRPEVIYVEMSRSKMSQFGISPEQIYRTLQDRNLVGDAGRVKVGPEYLAIETTGAIASVEEIGDTLLTRAGAGPLVYLKDVATIRRGYKEPPDTIFRQNGLQAIGLAISTVEGGNVVTMGEALEARLRELEAQRPVGMEFGIVALQSKAVTEAVNGFVVNLIEAIVIVIVVLLLFMGLRCGLIIGAILLITICGTFIVMQAWNILLERISLGALIIALGMLVDNAIVITEGMLIRIQQGEDRLEAAKKVVAQNLMPLLGATLVAVTAFAAIGTSQDSSGEYCRSLFLVLLISLLMSWLTAVTITPLFCYLFLKAKSAAASADPYGGTIYRGYRGLLSTALRFRWLTMLILAGLLGAAVFGFGFVESSFFPDSTRPQMMVDVFFPPGADIRKTAEKVQTMEQHVAGVEGVTGVTSFIGQGGPRFLLTYGPERPDPSYAQLLLDLGDYHQADTIKPKLEEYFQQTWPDAIVGVKKFVNGPSSGGRIQVRFSGPDGEVLRRLGDQAMAILHQADAVTVRTDWREKVKVLQVEMNETTARRAGITRADINRAIEENFDGVTTGLYREGDQLLPIIARAPQIERQDVAAISDLQVWSPAAGRMIPIRQVVNRFVTAWDDDIRMRRNRRPTLTVMADPKSGPASVLWQAVAPQIEAIELPAGYMMEWGGEYEDSAKAQQALAAKLPLFLAGMVLICIFLFNGLRQPLIIWLCVPLAIIGVTAGLLLTGQPFGFMALLGLLSLSGMLIKNAIVLLDEIGMQIAEGKAGLAAIKDSAVGRMRPVMMAAATTVLGMMPLIFDAFYVAMAVTIMFGLAFATALTLLVVPVLYSIFFRIKTGATHE